VDEVILERNVEERLHRQRYWREYWAHRM